MAVNLIAITFAEQSQAYQALSMLKSLDASGKAQVLSAAVVERDASGAVRIPEEADGIGGAHTAAGGLVGMLLGVIGGPLGMLLGLGTGALIGGAIDIDRADAGDQLIAEFSQAIPPGSNALVAEVDEVAVEVIDAAMTDLGGMVLRRPAADVLAEIEAANDAVEAAQKEARRMAREAKKAERHEAYEERKAKLRAKLHRD